MAADSRDWLGNRLGQQQQQQLYDPQSEASSYDLAAAPSFYKPVDGYAVHSLDDECCPAVVDKATFFGTLAFIAAGATYLVTLLLTNAVVNGLNIAGLINQLQNLININGIVAAVQNQVAQVQAGIAAIQNIIAGFGRRRRRSLSFSPVFMAGNGSPSPSSFVRDVYPCRRVVTGPPSRFRSHASLTISLLGIFRVLLWVMIYKAARVIL